jgi:sugar-specific transcriptional regulator TrmB
MSVAELAKKTNIQRTNIYHLLEPLITRGLVEQPERGLVRATNPQALRLMVAEQQAQAQRGSVELERIFPALSSLFTLAQEAPVIRSYEGLTGFKRMYTEMLATQPSVIRLFRSVSDVASPEFKEVVSWAITEQVERGIATRTITQNHPGAKRRYLSGADAANLVDRHIVAAGALNNPAQILLYNNTVCITSFEGSVITTIIENDMIALSFENIFEYCWQASAESTAQAFAEWEREDLPS